MPDYGSIRFGSEVDFASGRRELVLPRSERIFRFSLPEPQERSFVAKSFTASTETLFNFWIMGVQVGNAREVEVRLPAVHLRELRTGVIHPGVIVSVRVYNDSDQPRAFEGIFNGEYLQ